MRCPHCGYDSGPLTAGEIKIASAIADGELRDVIAKEKGISIHAVKQTLSRVYLKLDLKADDRARRIQLAAYWNRELFQIGLKELGLIA